ncbi:molybdenum cofactor biosynthesis protein MoaE [Rubinisphaera brasiliensis]|uniref:Molybdopterin synthase catalytic subunit n=1 Tax=Rubinisphaera brasiliensis (strain ATCC 49424 / DSM 5305 / JCM 21570 / IAM 15109 / NBRC 103401 / IFAM 1448) TaxID=756272 RepID=F0SFS7_RUBBR|nr:molybdenum cofactor biosynthesis protein MoaE [Rubinisphaera brasiliensis]ADY61534.1 molybdopterin synthase subunit MoaE [Rubinisphaera brasiliensis DSM 5305]
MPEPQLQICLTRDPIDHVELTEAVRSPLCGAVVSFLGTVRELTQGRQTTYLEYDAYAPMAESELRKLAEQAAEKWGLHAVAITHRLGALDLGDIAVAVAVSSPHRREAFEAASEIMSVMKQTVPIWKKETWADGETEWIHPE